VIFKHVNRYDKLFTINNDLRMGKEEVVVKESKLTPAQVEAEIPEDLKENSPPETVSMLDKRFDEVGFCIPGFSFCRTYLLTLR
jgi:hypothetical protein